jgi:hypothetical protein
MQLAKILNALGSDEPSTQRRITEEKEHQAVKGVCEFTPSRD